MPEVRKEERPAGWWDLRDLSGTLEGVSRAVAAAPEVPGHWKAAILEELKARCGTEFNFVWLDAHCHVEKGNAVLHVHVTPEKKLL